MSEGCCGPALDQTKAVEERYGAAAQEQEACLCTPVAFDASLLKVIPDEVVERDYGCGDPTRWVRPDDTKSEDTPEQALPTDQETSKQPTAHKTGSEDG